MLRGMSTISHYAEDLVAARDWYTTLLGVEPYFAREAPDGALAYVEWRVGDHQHELGIIDARFAPGANREIDRGRGLESVVFWAVDDVRAALDRLVGLGAAVVQPVTERGPGFVTAIARDPFGNLVGVMENAHYVEMLAERGA